MALEDLELAESDAEATQTRGNAREEEREVFIPFEQNKSIVSRKCVSFTFLGVVMVATLAALVVVKQHNKTQKDPWANYQEESSEDFLTAADRPLVLQSDGQIVAAAYQPTLVVHFEDFLDGQFYDTTPANLGNDNYRNNGPVDLSNTDGVLYVGHTAPGEYLKFDVSNLAPGSEYTLSIRYAANEGGRSVRAQFGSASPVDITLPATGGWYTWKFASVKVTIPNHQGSLVLTTTFNLDGMNLDYMKFLLTEPVPWVEKWVEEFDGAELNRSVWQVEVDCWGGGNNEKQCYTSNSRNVRTEKGKLIVTALRELYKGGDADCTRDPGDGCVGPKEYTSGRLRTLYSEDAHWTYGRFVIRAKLPSGRGLWPALWMLPTDKVFGGWASSGEIDIMEFDGNQRSYVSGTLHYGGAWPNNAYKGSGQKTIPGVSDLSAAFHDYILEWDVDEMRWYCDGYLFHSQHLQESFYPPGAKHSNPYSRPGQPWDQRFHFVINLAVGGWFLDGPDPTDVWADPTLQIESIRAYQRQSSL